VTTIRPNLPPPAPAAPRVADAARGAARAFFDLAAGRASAPTETASVEPAPAPVTPPPRVAAATAPERPLRPGSLLDIRV
jgi:hypothetical protein